MTTDHLGQLAFLRAVAAGLRGEFARITEEYEAGRISLRAEVDLLGPIIRESGLVASEIAALIELVA